MPFRFFRCLSQELKVSGRLVDAAQSESTEGGKLFIALCYSDVINTGNCRISASSAAIQCYNLMTFHSMHGLDMKYLGIDVKSVSLEYCDASFHRLRVISILKFAIEVPTLN
jgi:hypothetical protein